MYIAKDVVPSVFLVELIEVNEEDGTDEMGTECGTCESMKREVNELRMQIVKLSMDYQMKEAKSNKKIEKLNCMVDEKTKENHNLQKRIHGLTIKTNMLEEEIFTIRTDPIIHVRARKCLQSYIYLLIRHSISLPGSQNEKTYSLLAFWC